MRRSALQAVALEGARGWRIAKEKASHKIDLIVALAQAALGAVEQRGAGRMEAFDFWTGEPVSLAVHEADLPTFDLGFTDSEGNPVGQKC